MLTTERQQLSFLPELDRQLDEQRGRAVQLPIDASDIGGALLALLSNGLYTNPLDCIREYVQNAVDAQARNVSIKITGNSVTIHDDGTGMDLRDLLRARQFGLSPKSLAEYVGFRGIGIYSGFDLCQRLRITSTKEADPHVHVLTFEFAAMRAQLEQDKNLPSDAPKTSLIELLSSHTRVSREQDGYGEDAHFTVVELQNINDIHIRELADRNKMRNYLLHNLPVDFADDFEYKQQINEHLALNVSGFHAVRITLLSDGLPDELVAKEAIEGLRAPEFGFITTGTPQQKQIAYYWACLSNRRGRVQPKSLSGKGLPTEDSVSYEGFLYKVKGFTIGDRQKLRVMFQRKPQLYPWYTGEIYVLDPHVIPNAERDDFETNPAKRSLEIAVREKLKELETAAEKVQARDVADERITNYQEDLARINEQIQANLQGDPLTIYSSLDRILEDIKRQKSKASDQNRRLADELGKLAANLQKQLRKQVDLPVPEATQRKRAARKVQPADRGPIPVIALPPPTPPKTLPGVLKDAGWEAEVELLRLAHLIQDSLESVLTLHSALYRNIMNDIEAKLAGADSDE